MTVPLDSSTSQDLVVSVDIGTTSTRAIAFNKLAQVISTVQIEYDQCEYRCVEADQCARTAKLTDHTLWLLALLLRSVVIVYPHPGWHEQKMTDLIGTVWTCLDGLAEVSFGVDTRKATGSSAILILVLYRNSRRWVTNLTKSRELVSCVARFG
jgi:glycerol kinase